MSEKKDIRIVCDRCGQEIQSANEAYFRKFYVENQSSVPHTLAEYKFTTRTRNATHAIAKPGLGYIMRGATMRLDDGTVDLCAACAKELNEWWDTWAAENGGNPFKHCGLERMR